MQSISLWSDSKNPILKMQTYCKHQAEIQLATEKGEKMCSTLLMKLHKLQVQADENHKLESTLENSVWSIRMGEGNRMRGRFKFGCNAKNKLPNCCKLDRLGVQMYWRQVWEE